MSEEEEFIREHFNFRGGINIFSLEDLIKVLKAYKKSLEPNILVIDINKEKEALEEKNRENLPTFNKEQLH